ncbi:UNVERIFIED_CONTAM: hypothetical protein GTU68_007477 [Idotea baltica]|nr:hypothetical protein [Idotea baltica]
MLKWLTHCRMSNAFLSLKSPSIAMLNKQLGVRAFWKPIRKLI